MSRIISFKDINQKRVIERSFETVYDCIDDIMERGSFSEEEIHKIIAIAYRLGYEECIRKIEECK